MNRRRILASLGSHTPTAKDYVQDGLVAMWDGIENTGWGVHDPNATVWKNLVSSGDLRIGSNATVVENGVDVSDGRIASGSIVLPDTFSMESVSAHRSFPQWRTFLMACIAGDYVGAKGFHFGLLGGKVCFSNPGYKTSGEENYSEPLLNTNYALNTNQKYSLSCSFDSTDLIIYSGGDIIGMRSGMIDMKKTSNFYIGRSDFIDWGSINGTSFCTRLYNRALTAAEVAANCAVDKARFGLPDVT